MFETTNQMNIMNSISKRIHCYYEDSIAKLWTHASHGQAHCKLRTYIFTSKKKAAERLQQTDATVLKPSTQVAPRACRKETTHQNIHVDSKEIPECWLSEDQSIETKVFRYPKTDVDIKSKSYQLYENEIIWTCIHHDDFEYSRYLNYFCWTPSISPDFTGALPQGKPAETLKTMPKALAIKVWRPTT